MAAQYDAGFPPFSSDEPLDRSRAAGTGQGGAELLCRSRRLSASMRGAWPTATRYIGIKRLGAGQFYLISIKDKDGESL